MLGVFARSLRLPTYLSDTLTYDAGCSIVAKADSYRGCTDVGVALATTVNWQMKDVLLFY